MGASCWTHGSRARTRNTRCTPVVGKNPNSSSQSKRGDELVDLSIITLTRNTCAQTAACMASVFANPTSLKMEVFLMDNASTDETPNVVPAQFPAVRYRRFERNLGFARAANLAAHEATGDSYCCSTPARVSTPPRSAPPWLGCALILSVAWLARNCWTPTDGGKIPSLISRRWRLNC